MDKTKYNRVAEDKQQLQQFTEETIDSFSDVNAAIHRIVPGTKWMRHNVVIRLSWTYAGETRTGTIALNFISTKQDQFTNNSSQLAALAYAYNFGGSTYNSGPSNDIVISINRRGFNLTTKANDTSSIFRGGVFNTEAGTYIEPYYGGIKWHTYAKDTIDTTTGLMAARVDLISDVTITSVGDNVTSIPY